MRQETKVRQMKIHNSALLFHIAAKNALGRARVCDCTHSQDEQKHVRSRAKVQASLAMIHRYREPLVKACLLEGRYQPQQSSETRMCKPGRYQYALQPCGGSSRDMLVSEDTQVQLIFQQGN